MAMLVITRGYPGDPSEKDQDQWPEPFLIGEQSMAISESSGATQ